MPRRAVRGRGAGDRLPTGPSSGRFRQPRERLSSRRFARPKPRLDLESRGLLLPVMGRSPIRSLMRGTNSFSGVGQGPIKPPRVLDRPSYRVAEDLGDSPPALREAAFLPELAASRDLSGSRDLLAGQRRPVTPPTAAERGAPLLATLTIHVGLADRD